MEHYDYIINVFWLSAEKILELKYAGYDKTFQLANFRFDYLLRSVIKGNKARLVQIVNNKPYTIKIGENNYEKEKYETSFGQLKNEKGLISLKEKSIGTMKVGIEYVFYQELYLEFFRITTPPLKDKMELENFINSVVTSIDDCDNQFENNIVKDIFIKICLEKLLSQNCTNSLKNLDLVYPIHPPIIYLPLKNSFFKEGNFVIKKMIQYEESMILEEIHHLTRQYVKLHESKKCDC